ncbi:MAG: DUF4124 domain-containing protein [Gallionella sp.]|jgi:chromosome segregation ATPase
MNKYLFVLILLFALPVSAKTYKWVDDKGVTHMGDTIPPEYADKDRQLLNKSGTVIKTQDILTPEDRRAQEAASAKARADETTARDQKLHDKSLTDTYSNVEEIELSRTRNIQQVDARINSINSQMKTANNNLAILKKDAASRSKIPASLHEDIKEAQDRINRMQQDLQKYKDEKQAVEARYDADKARYKELTGK